RPVLLRGQLRRAILRRLRRQDGAPRRQRRAADVALRLPQPHQPRPVVRPARGRSGALQLLRVLLPGSEATGVHAVRVVEPLRAAVRRASDLHQGGHMRAVVTTLALLAGCGGQAPATDDGAAPPASCDVARPTSLDRLWTRYLQSAATTGTGGCAFMT